MNLKHLTDHVLLQDTKRLVSEERRLTTQILHHLKEIDRRKLYSDYKYESLFDYCTKDLGYSAAGAHRRIVAARLLKDLPQIESKIDNGLLSLTNVAEANKYFNQNEIKSPAEKLQILSQIEGLSSRECEKKFFSMSGVTLPTRESEKRISETDNKVTIILSNETIKLLNEVKNTLTKKYSMNDLIELMAMETLKILKKKKFSLKIKSLTSLPAPEVNLKRISSSVRRTVYSRDQKCTNCGSIHRLNFDHRVPKALGGGHSAENIRLLCFNCNQRARIRARL